MRVFVGRGRLACTSLLALVGAVACHRGAASNEPCPQVLEPLAVPQAAVAAPPVALRTVEGITEYQLDNGLRVLLVPDPSRDRVTVNITYLVGSRHESYGETGMAHLLEHMLFKGTLAVAEPSAELEAHGADYNGTTWYDRTNYFETMPASAENLAWAIEFEADRMRQSLIDPDDLAKEFSVVKNELQMGENDPEQIVDERMLSTAFLWHNYGKSTIGAPSDLDNVQAPTLRKFYDHYYQPDNAVLVVAGAFDEAHALALVAEHFGAIARPNRTLATTYTVEPIQDGEREVILRRVGDVAIVSALYHGVAGADERYTAGEALVHLLTDEPSGRLFRRLVQTGLASSVYGSTQALHDPGWVQFFAEVPPGGSAEKVREVLLETLDELEPITEAEVARYRNRRSKELGLSMTDSTDTAIELSEWAALGDWRMLFVYRDRVETTGVPAVQAFADEFLVPSNRTVGMFVPTPEPKRAPGVSVPDVAAAVDGYQGRGAPRDGEVFAATIDNIEARTQRVTTADGIRLALLPKRTRGGTVTFQMRLRAGSVESLRGRDVAASYVGDMMMRGTRSRTRQELRDEFDRLRAEVWISGRTTGGVVQFETQREHVPEVVALVAEMLREPAFSVEEFELLRQEELASWQARRSDPEVQAFDRLWSVLRPLPVDDPRAPRSTSQWVERLSKLKVRDLSRVHSELWGAGDVQISVVGDFDPVALRTAVDEHLGAWAAPTSPERLPAVYHSIAPAPAHYIDTPDKEMAVVTMAQNFALRDDHPDYPALVLATYVLGGADASRLVMRLREREGWSYHAYASVHADAHEAAATLLVGAQSAPKSVDKMRAAMDEELAAWLSKPVPVAELDAAKATYRALFETSLSGDRAIARRHVEDLYLGRTLRDTARRLDAIDAVTPQQLLDAVARHVKRDGFTTVVAGDFQKMGRARPKSADGS